MPNKIIEKWKIGLNQWEAILVNKPSINPSASQKKNKKRKKKNEGPKGFQKLGILAAECEIKLQACFKKALDPDFYDKYLDPKNKNEEGRYNISVADNSDLLFVYQNILNILIDSQVLAKPVHEAIELYRKKGKDEKTRTEKLKFLFGNSKMLNEVANVAGERLLYLLDSMEDLGLFDLGEDLPGWEGLKAYFKTSFLFLEVMGHVDENPIFQSFEEHEDEWRKPLGLPPVKREGDENKVQANESSILEAVKNESNEVVTVIKTLDAHFDILGEEVNTILRDLKKGEKNSEEVEKAIDETVKTLRKLRGALQTFNSRPRGLIALLRFVGDAYPAINKLIEFFPKSLTSISETLNEHLLTTANQFNLVLRSCVLYKDRMEIQLYTNGHFFSSIQDIAEEFSVLIEKKGCQIKAEEHYPYLEALGAQRENLYNILRAKDEPESGYRRKFTVRRCEELSEFSDKKNAFMKNLRNERDGEASVEKTVFEIKPNEVLNNAREGVNMFTRIKQIYGSYKQKKSIKNIETHKKQLEDFKNAIDENSARIKEDFNLFVPSFDSENARQVIKQKRLDKQEKDKIKEQMNQVKQELLQKIEIAEKEKERQRTKEEWQRTKNEERKLQSYKQTLALDAITMRIEELQKEQSERFFSFIKTKVKKIDLLNQLKVNMQDSTFPLESYLNPIKKHKDYGLLEEGRTGQLLKKLFLIKAESPDRLYLIHQELDNLSKEKERAKHYWFFAESRRAKLTNCVKALNVLFSALKEQETLDSALQVIADKANGQGEEKKQYEILFKILNKDEAPLLANIREIENSVRDVISRKNKEAEIAIKPPSV